MMKTVSYFVRMYFLYANVYDCFVLHCMFMLDALVKTSFFCGSLGLEEQAITLGLK